MLTDAGDGQTAVREILPALGAVLGCDAAAVWWVTPSADQLTPGTFWSVRPLPALRRALRAARPRAAVGRVGRAWVTGAPVEAATLRPRAPNEGPQAANEGPAAANEGPVTSNEGTVTSNEGAQASYESLPAAAAREAGLPGGLAVPVGVGPDVRAVLQFFSSDTLRPDDALLESLGVIGGQLGLLLAREAVAGRSGARRADDAPLDAWPDAAVTVDATGTIRSANPALERVLGWPSAEAVGLPLTRLLPLERLAGEPAALLCRLEVRGRRTGRPAVDLPGLRRDGRRVRLDVSCGSFMRDGERLFVVSLRDATSRVRRCRRLEASVARLTATVAELNARRTGAEAAREQAEAARREAEAARLGAESARQAAVTAADWSSFLAEAGRALGTTLDRDDVLRVLAGLAVPAIADFCVVDVVRESGELARVQVAHREGLARARVEEFLRRNRPRLPAREGPPAVIRSGQPQLHRQVGEAELRMFTQDEQHLGWLRGLGITSLMIVPLMARGRALGAITLATSQSGRRYDTPQLAIVEALAGRAASAMDNADLYEQALSANRAKSNFLAIMSHELRTPLTAIMGYADILREGIAGELRPRQERYLERVLVSAHHLLRLIDEILTFTRLEFGREPTRWARVSLRDLTREIANLARPSMAEKRLAFEAHLPPRQAYLETDPEKVRQVLLDILLNAVKFTPHGRVTLDVRVEDEQVVFDIQDTGIGIEPADLARVFEPFWQAEDAMTRREGGTGIGLAVARRLARLLGGDIEASSEPGQGTLFRVHLPLRAPLPDDAAA